MAGKISEDDAVTSFAAIDRIHSGYAASNHTHSDYADAGHTHTIANITGLQNIFDGKASSSHTHTDYAASDHTHTVANISDLNATETELNYMGGVASNVQTQLDGKAADLVFQLIATVQKLSQEVEMLKNR